MPTTQAHLFLSWRRLNNSGEPQGGIAEENGLCGDFGVRCLDSAVFESGANCTHVVPLAEAVKYQKRHDDELELGAQ